MKNTFSAFVFAFFFGLAAVAQTAGEQLIHFKQRYLKPKEQLDLMEAKDSLRTLHLMIAGNVYQTEKHISYCYDKESGQYNFRDELKYIQPILSLGDIAIANLKTSFAGDVYNMFSAPDEFALALKYSGINAVMHANLHTANVDRATFKRTRELMNTFDMHYTGAFTDNFQRNGNYPLIINKKGFRIALLNYGALDHRPEISGNFYINEIDKEQIEMDFRMLRAYKPDFTIVYFDWGTEKQEVPSYNQIDLARFCFQYGADLVVGANPNTPMRLDYVNYYRDGQSKEGIVAYSLGNLIASTEDVRNRNGYVIDMELKKNNYTGETYLGDWGVIPVYTYYDTLSVRGKTKVFTVPCSSVESNDILASLPYIEKRRVVNGAFEVRKLLGGTADEIQYNLTELVANNVMETIDLTNASWNNKYAPKRAREIPATGAPLIAAKDFGNTNAPSISQIYGDEKPKAKDFSDEADRNSDRRYEEEKKKADEARAKNLPTKYNKPKKEIPSSDTSENYATKVTRNENEVTVVSGSVVSKKEETKKQEQPAPVATQATNNGTTTPAAKKEEPRPVAEGIKVEQKNSEGVTTNDAGKTDIKPVENKNLKLVVDTFYRIQFYVLKKYLPLDTNYYTHLKGYEVVEDAGQYRYLLGKFRSYEECYKYWKAQIQPRYKESVIIKFLDGKRLLE
jgi:poly-gamma-glutamate synthesis protein (capsule biosynthesis protein)